MSRRTPADPKSWNTTAMSRDYQVSEGSQNREKHRRSRNKRERKKPEEMGTSDTYIPRASIFTVPERKKPTWSSFTETVSDYLGNDDRSTSGIRARNEATKTLPFRDKGKVWVNSGSRRELSAFFNGEVGQDASKATDILLVVDLNSRYPTAAFNAPSLGYSKYKLLPPLEATPESRYPLLGSSESSPSSSRHRKSSLDSTKDLLSHCQTHLQSELGKPLKNFKPQVFFTARGDASDRSKHILSKAVKDTDSFISTEDSVQIFPTIEAITIEAIFRQEALNLKNDSSYQVAAPRTKTNILVLHFDGDVAEIQSYSVSWTAPIGKFDEPRLRLEEIVYGETVDCGKLVDRQFDRWIQKSFGNSISNISARKFGIEGRLMTEFAEARRYYKMDRKDMYGFPLTLRNPPNGSPYDPRRHVCQVQDYEMQKLFEPAMDSLLKSLDNLQARLGEKKTAVDNVIFAGVKGISPYVEDHVKDWGVGVSLLHTKVYASTITLARYMRFEST
jgi:hypothetical protein